MFRKTVFASFLVLGAVVTAGAQAAEGEPQLVNRNGSQEVVYGGALRNNVVGSAFATVTGGGDDLVYGAAPGARAEAPELVGRLSGGGDDEAITYAAPARAARPGARG